MFHLEEFEPFSFAGIWTARETDDGWQHNYAILTGPALPELAEIHGRMPVMLGPEPMTHGCRPIPRIRPL